VSLGVTKRFLDKVTEPLLGFNRAIETIGEQGELTFGPELVNRASLVEILSELPENLLRLRESHQREEPVATLVQRLSTVVGIERRRMTCGFESGVSYFTTS
jgi:hypothetical protein